MKPGTHVYRVKQIQALVEGIEAQNRVLSWLLQEIDAPRISTERLKELDQMMLETVTIIQTLSQLVQEVSARLPATGPTLQ